MSFYGGLESKMMKIGEKVNNNNILMTIRDAFMLVFPFTIFGSIGLVISNFPYLDKIIGKDAVASLQKYLGPMSSATMSIMTILVCLGIGYYLCKRKGGDPIYGAAIALTSFFLLTPFELTTDGGESIINILSFDRLGAKGMFVGIIGSFIAAYLFSYFTNKGFKIKMPDAVPDAVSNSFSSLIPAVCTLTFFIIVRTLFSFTSWGNIHDFIYEIIQKPLTHLGSGLIPTLIIVLITQVLWFFGLHGQVIVNSVMDPIWRSLSLENYDAWKAGAEIPNIVTKQFMDTFTVGLGGTGMTLIVVVLLLIFMKSRQLKEVCRLASVPGMFNINEPCIFGLPIVLNPSIAIPWIVAPILATLFAYICMSIGVLPYTTGVEVPWTTPVLFNGFLSTNSIMGSLVQLAQMAIVAIVWLPFLRAMDKRNLVLEEKNK